MIASSHPASLLRTTSQLGLEKSKEAASSSSVSLPARFGLNPLLQEFSVLEIVDIRYFRLNLRLRLVEREESGYGVDLVTVLVVARSFSCRDEQ